MHTVSRRPDPLRPEPSQVDAELDSVRYCAASGRAWAEEEPRQPPLPGLFAACPVPMWIHAADSQRILAVNAAACAQYGWTHAEFLRLSVDALRPEEERAREASPASLAFHDGLVRHVRRGGKVIEVELETLAIEFEGRGARLVIARDVTERVRIERELRASHARMRLLLEGSRDAIFEGGLDGRSVHFASPACEALFGVPPQAFIDDPELWLRLVVPEDLETIARLVGELREHGQSEGEYRFQRPDGEFRWAHSRAWTVRDEQGKAVSFAAAVRDVTERHEAEAQLRLANVELEERVESRTRELQELHHAARAFAFTVAHELRAPLRVLEGFTTLLRSEPNEELTADARLLLDQIGESARAMSGIVSGHLTLARLEHAELHLVEADARAIVAEVLREQATSLEGRRVELTVGPLPSVRADAALLRQVFSNLLSNAIKYTRSSAEPHIEIGARAAGAHAVFYVRDNGVGFDPAHAEGLFSPFCRLHDDFDGTGIGLATVRRIVELHGGRVWAESAPGNGATFAFTLSST
ncbi:MAG: PAS domain S-box protein [Planctomycetes bacterium]|nr:PAS domain S-box protein [Planctomycetota bacterium]